MPHSESSTSTTYPKWIGFIFIFNLIVGTGALTLPSAFANAGWLLSLVVIILLALISFVTVTFVIEAMACTNAIRNWQNLQIMYRRHHINDVDDVEHIETEALIRGDLNQELERLPLQADHSSNYYYRLDQKFEIGEMATIFFNDFGRILFYICFTIYLFGDLSIYSAAIAKSLRDIVCNRDNNDTVAVTTHHLWIHFSDLDKNVTCWQNYSYTRFEVYRIFLIGFTIIFGPFAAFSINKTKYLQVLTVILRWLAFIFMICISVKILVSEGAKGHPAPIKFYGIPSLFGACVYSFMCHHSLPNLLAPIRDKQNIRKILSYDYVVICAFYIILTMTGIFAFEHLEDLYTLNFMPTSSTNNGFPGNLFIIAIEYFLALFPIFTLSTSYPIIAITLRNNLQSLFLDMTRFETYNIFERRILFPLCAVCPPFIITYFTESLTSLVAFTGSYAGTSIQYIIPVALVYFARRTCKDLIGSGIVNQFQSPFYNNYWLVVVLIWSILCVCLVTLNYFI